MDPPHFLLDALKASITSGTFIDTKFYVFSLQDSSGCVGFPRPLYCNSRVLNTVPYFSTLFSNGYSEGKMKNLNEGFPSDTPHFADDYDYLSDSDLEDDETELSIDDRPSDSRFTLTKATAEQPHPSQGTTKVENLHGPENNFSRTGKVAIIRDMAAVTFEAMICFLYTGNITFAPFSSDPRHKLPAEERAGDWTIARLPLPSAKSIYRLADKYDIPTLKERAKAHIHDNLAHCSIVDEVFSGFSVLFPEIRSLQISRLVRKIKEESVGNAEGETTRLLRQKIASLSQSDFSRFKDVLVSIWSGATGPLDSTAPKPTFASSTNIPIPPNWYRVELALLKSIHTGIFIDVQFYAYNAIDQDSDLPVDPKPLFTSSIVIEKWGPTIATQTVGVEAEVVCLVDGLTDDYEFCNKKLLEAQHKDKAHLYWTEAVTADKSHEVVMLASGAWRTWRSLLSCAYIDRMDFAPLRTPGRECGLAMNTEMQSQLLCSPRSMYSLATALGIETIKEEALKGIQSKLTTSNIIQELFTPFTESHEAVTEMEVEFLQRNVTEQHSKLVIEHIQNMESGQAPFFPTTLSLVYRKLLGKLLTQPTASGPDLGKPETGNRRLVNPAPAIQEMGYATGVGPSFASSGRIHPSWQAPAPAPRGPTPQRGKSRRLRHAEQAARQWHGSGSQGWGDARGGDGWNYADWDAAGGDADWRAAGGDAGWGAGSGDANQGTSRGGSTDWGTGNVDEDGWWS